MGADRSGHLYAVLRTDRVYLTSADVLSRVAPRSQISTGFDLSQNYPNPFNPSTTIKFELPRASQVNLTVFNTLGQKVRTLVDETVDAGYQSVEFDASGLASGVYLYRLQAGNFVQSRKLLLLR